MMASIIFSMATLYVGLALGDCQIVDTHVHNSFIGQLDYSFPRKFPDLAKRSYNMSDFVDATRPHTITAVLMELDKAGDVANQSLAEAHLYQATANRCHDDQSLSCHVAGIVASAPVTEGATAMKRFIPTLLATAPLVRGIREAIWTQPSAYFVNSTYWSSLRELTPFNLTLDLLCNHAQLDDIRSLAAALPNTPINIDHIAYPNISAPISTSANRDWAEAMRRLASMPNVYIKLSGLPQGYGGKGWSSADFCPFISVALQAFGADRINFAGNWFVLDEFGTYGSMLSAVKECLDILDVSVDDRAAIFAGTAQRLYRLSL